MLDEEQPQKPSESGQGLLQGFGGVDGIHNAREVHVKQATTLEKLLEVTDRVITHGENQEWFKILIKNNRTIFNVENEVYCAMYNKLVQDELKDIQYTKQDLTEFIFANTNKDERYAFSPTNPHFFGIFTGCLLHILTERNAVQGKRTRFYINGQGRRFDFLFAYAKKVDDVIVDNFIGRNICTSICSYEGSANFIALLNIDGKDAADGIATKKGKIEQAAMINCVGGYSSSQSSSDGEIKRAVMINDIYSYLPQFSINHRLGKIHVNPCLNTATAKINSTILLDYRFDPVLHANDTETDTKAVPMKQMPFRYPIFKNLLYLAAQLRDKPEEEKLKHLDELRRIMPNLPCGYFVLR